jgi:hypothetical protein
MNIEKENVSRKSAALTAVLCILFGGIGAHRFYTGKYLSGLAYLVFGSSTIAIQLLSRIDVIKGTLIGIFLIVLVGVALLYDLFALYNGSFLDSNGKVILSGSAQDEYVGRTLEEKSEDSDSIVFVFISIAIFISLIIILPLILERIS